VSSQLQELVKLRDFVDGAAKTLAFHLEPKVGKTLICSEVFVELGSFLAGHLCAIDMEALCCICMHHRSVLHALFDACRLWSSRCPCTAMDAPRKSRSTSPRWTV
jgi:hypothetical protein